MPDLPARRPRGRPRGSKSGRTRDPSTLTPLVEVPLWCPPYPGREEDRYPIAVPVLPLAYSTRATRVLIMPLGLGGYGYRWVSPRTLVFPPSLCVRDLPTAEPGFKADQIVEFARRHFASDTGPAADAATGHPDTAADRVDRMLPNVRVVSWPTSFPLSSASAICDGCQELLEAHQTDLAYSLKLCTSCQGCEHYCECGDGRFASLAVSACPSCCLGPPNPNHGACHRCRTCGGRCECRDKNIAQRGQYWHPWGYTPEETPS